MGLCFVNEPLFVSKHAASPLVVVPCSALKRLIGEELASPWLPRPLFLLPKNVTYVYLCLLHDSEPRLVHCLFQQALWERSH